MSGTSSRFMNRSRSFKGSVTRSGGMKKMRIALVVDPELTAQVNAAAQAVRQRAKLYLQTTAPGGRLYTNITDYNGAVHRSHRASKPGQMPATFTGNLIKGLRLQRAKPSAVRKVAKVSNVAPHAHLLEFGTVNMEARPFMKYAMRDTRAENYQRLKAGAVRSVRAAALKARSEGSGA